MLRTISFFCVEDGVPNYYYVENQEIKTSNGGLIMKKKIIALTLAAVTALSVIGCGGSSENEGSQSAE